MNQDTIKEQKEIIKTIKKLEAILNDLKTEKRHFNITRMIVIKGLCTSSIAKTHFAKYLSEKAFANYKNKNKENPELTNLFESALKIMNDVLLKQKDDIEIDYSKEEKEQISKTINKLYQYQNKGRDGHYGTWIREIKNDNLLTVEKGLKCFRIGRFSGNGYELTKNYVEKYNGSYGTGLIPDSIPYLQDVVVFWQNYYSDILKNANNLYQTKKRKPRVKVEDLLKKVDKNDLKEFIIEYAKQDTKFRRDFVKKFRE